MKRILIVGSGDVALRAIPWLVKRFTVYAVVRRAETAAGLRAQGAIPLLADLDDPRTLRRLAGIADAVMHFAPPPPSGSHDPRTARLLAAVARRGSLPQRLIYISTTGVYGDCGGARVDETRPCRPDTARARRRVDAERRVRRFAARNGVRVSILRAPGIYAADRLPLERLRARTPVLRAEDDVYTSHIHADDLAAIALRALEPDAPPGVYNAADDTEMRMGDWLDLVADFSGVPRLPRVPRSQITSLFATESRRLDNRRLKTVLGFTPRYRTVHEGLRPRFAYDQALGVD